MSTLDVQAHIIAPIIELMDLYISVIYMFRTQRLLHSVLCSRLCHVQLYRFHLVGENYIHVYLYCSVINATLSDGRTMISE